MTVSDSRNEWQSDILFFKQTKTSAFNRCSAECRRLFFVLIRGFSKISIFGKATIDLNEKVVVRTLFQELFPKLTEFWKKLKD